MAIHYFIQRKKIMRYIYKINFDELKIVIADYKSVKVLKSLNHTNQWFVLEVDRKELIVYDLLNARVMFYLPIQHNFVDIAILEDSNAIMIGKEKRDVSVYSDDCDYAYIILNSFLFDLLSGKIEIIDELSVVNWDNGDDYVTSPSSIRDMKFPLFDNFLYSWPKEISISALGNYIVYYCDDIKGIIISDFQNGNVYRMFSLPKKRTNKTQYFFNEKTNIFTILDINSIERYYVRQESTELLKSLNEVYNSFIHIKQILEIILDLQVYFIRCF